MPASCGVWLLCWGVDRGAGGLVGPRFLSTTHRECPRDARWSKDVSKTEEINAPADPTPHRRWRDDLHRQNRRSRSGDRSPPFWTSWPKFLSPGLDGSGARRTLRNCRSSHAQARRFRGARAGYHGAVPHYWPHHCRGVLFFRICRICRPDTASPSPPLCSGAFRGRCWRSGLPRRARSPRGRALYSTARNGLLARILRCAPFVPLSRALRRGGDRLRLPAEGTGPP